jgi:hypothetical protein
MFYVSVTWNISILVKGIAPIKEFGDVRAYIKFNEEGTSRVAIGESTQLYYHIIQ